MESILQDYRSFLLPITLQYPIGSAGTGVAMLRMMDEIKAFSDYYTVASKGKAEEYLKGIEDESQRETLSSGLYDLRLEVYCEHVPANFHFLAVGLKG